MEEREVNAIVPHGHEYRQSTDAAGLCGAIVKQTASNIQGRKYVSVEGWQAIAIAHGCAAGSRDVEKIEGGVRAIGEVRRMDDGQLIATAEGFVGEDEPTWFGGSNGRGRTLPKRPDYAIRAMAQTRAISRACRSAFAHVVVMIDAGLSTTPAEEVPEGGFVEGQVLEGAVSPREPAEDHGVVDHLPPHADEPNRRTGVKLDGPHTSITGLEKAIKAFVSDMDKCIEWEDWNGLRNDKKYAGLLVQAERDHPDWWNGWIGMPERFTPLSRRIEILEANLAERKAQYINA
jgi:hypothetical protein